MKLLIVDLGSSSSIRTLIIDKVWIEKWNETVKSHNITDEMIKALVMDQNTGWFDVNENGNTIKRMISLIPETIDKSFTFKKLNDAVADYMRLGGSSIGVGFGYYLYSNHGVNFKESYALEGVDEVVALLRPELTKTLDEILGG